MSIMRDFNIDLLKNAFEYNHETGKLYWKIATGKSSIGKECGSISVTGYLKITFLGRTYLAHRIAWALFHNQNPPDVIDHINGDKLDNRILNLRNGVCFINQQNQKKAHSRNKSSSYLGVSKFKDAWRAKIYHNKKYYFLGYHATEELAHQAYLKAKRELHISCTI